MTETPPARAFEIARLGEAGMRSPFVTSYVDDGERLLFASTVREVERAVSARETLASFEVAGPRERIFFEPSDLHCGIVTCGGLCPGLNDVTRAIVLGLHHHYGVRSILGFRLVPEVPFGVDGLVAALRARLAQRHPSYGIRSAPANARDAAFCLALAHNAVHAGMSGRTDMIVGFWMNEFTHVPIALAVSERNRIDPAGRLWNHVLAATGQPRAM